MARSYEVFGAESLVQPHHPLSLLLSPSTNHKFYLLWCYRFMRRQIVLLAKSQCSLDSRRTTNRDEIPESTRHTKHKAQEQAALFPHTTNVSPVHDQLYLRCIRGVVYSWCVLHSPCLVRLAIRLCIHLFSEDPVSHKA